VHDFLTVCSVSILPSKLLGFADAADYETGNLLGTGGSPFL